MDLGGPTMVAVGRATPGTMERCQKNLHHLDGEHQQAQVGYARCENEVGRAASRGICTMNISKRKQASPGVCALVIFLISLGVISLLKNSIQVREPMVRDCLWRSHPLATGTRYFANFGKKGPARKGVPIENPTLILVTYSKRDIVCDFLHVMLAVGTRSAELPRVADGEMAPGDEYCHTKLLTFKG